MVTYICQLPLLEQETIREKLKKYLKMEGFEGESLVSELEETMCGKIDDIDWRAINAVIEHNAKVDFKEMTLGQLRNYFNNRSDADHDGEQYVPNEAMKILSDIECLQLKIEEYETGELLDPSPELDFPA